MVTAKERYYYTAKKVEEGVFQFQKWDSLGSEDAPCVIYTTHAYGGSRASCSCPAWRPCKHMKAIDEICDKGLQGQLPFMKWTEKHGWSTTEDM